MEEQGQSPYYLFQKAFDIFTKGDKDIFLVDSIYCIHQGVKKCIEINDLKPALEFASKNDIPLLLKKTIVNEIITASRILKDENSLLFIINSNLFEEKYIEKAKIVLESIELENPEKLLEKCMDEKIQIEKRIEYGKDLLAIYASANSYKKILDLCINQKIPNEVKEKSGDFFISHYLLSKPELLHQMVKENSLPNEFIQRIKDAFDRIELSIKGEFKKEIGSSQELVLKEISKKVKKVTKII